MYVPYLSYLLRYITSMYIRHIFMCTKVRRARVTSGANSNTTLSMGDWNISDEPGVFLGKISLASVARMIYYPSGSVCGVSALRDLNNHNILRYYAKQAKRSTTTHATSYTSHH